VPGGGALLGISGNRAAPSSPRRGAWQGIPTKVGRGAEDPGHSVSSFKRRCLSDHSKISNEGGRGEGERIEKIGGGGRAREDYLRELHCVEQVAASTERSGQTRKRRSGL